MGQWGDGESLCKRDPVSRFLDLVTIHLCGLPEERPVNRAGRTAHLLCLTLLQVGFAKLRRSPGALVRSYRTVSALPVPLLAIGGLSLLHCP